MSEAYELMDKHIYKELVLERAQQKKLQKQQQQAGGASATAPAAGGAEDQKQRARDFVTLLTEARFEKGHLLRIIRMLSLEP